MLLRQYLPSNVEVIVGRDLYMDGPGQAAADAAGIRIDREKRLKAPEFARAAAAANAYYRQAIGQHFNAVYKFSTGGCVHSKVMVMIYPTFLRVVVTSANFMTIGASTYSWALFLW